MLANGDLERRCAYSEVFSVRASLISTDGFDVILDAMNKSVGVSPG
jgi:hypothetical protein